MRRLVDIDEVIKVAKNTFPQEDVRKIMWVLCHTPTAYDVEKVVAELESLSNAEADYYYATSNDVIDRENAIDIVKRGGVE